MLVQAFLPKGGKSPAKEKWFIKGLWQTLIQTLGGKGPVRRVGPRGTRIKITAQKDVIQEDSGIRGGGLGKKETHQAHILMERAPPMQGKCLLSNAVNYFLNRRSPFSSFHCSTISISFIPQSAVHYAHYMEPFGAVIQVKS